MKKKKICEKEPARFSHNFLPVLIFCHSKNKDICENNGGDYGRINKNIRGEHTGKECVGGRTA